MKSTRRAAWRIAAIVVLPAFCFVGCPEMDEELPGTLEGKWRTFFDGATRSVTVTIEFGASTWIETAVAIDTGIFEDSETVVQLFLEETGTYFTDTTGFFNEIDMFHGDLPELEVFRSPEGIREVRALLATATEKHGDEEDEVELRVEDLEVIALSLTGIEFGILDLLEQQGIFYAEYRLLTGTLTESDQEMVEDTLADLQFDFVIDLIQTPGAPHLGIYEIDRNVLSLESDEVRPRDFNFNQVERYARIL